MVTRKKQVSFTTFLLTTKGQGDEVHFEGKPPVEGSPANQPEATELDAIDSLSQFLSESIASVAQGVESVSASVAEGVSTLDFNTLSTMTSEGMNSVAESLSSGVEAVVAFADSASKQITGEAEGRISFWC